MKEGKKRGNIRSDGDDDARARNEAIRGQRAVGVSASPDKGRSRPTYPSDKKRYDRSLTLVLPRKEDVLYLEREAKRLKAGFSTTGFATLLLIKAMEMWRDGKLRLGRKEISVEKFVIELNE